MEEKITNEPASRKPFKVAISAGIFLLMVILLMLAVALIISGDNGSKIETGYDFSKPESVLAQLKLEASEQIPEITTGNILESMQLPSGIETMSFKMNISGDMGEGSNFKLLLSGLMANNSEGTVSMEMEGSLSGNFGNEARFSESKPIKVEAKLIGEDVYIKFVDLTSLPKEAIAGLTVMGLGQGKWVKVSISEYLDLAQTVPTTSDLDFDIPFSEASDGGVLTKGGITYTCINLPLSSELLPSSGELDFKMCAVEGKYYPMYYLFEMNVSQFSQSVQMEMFIDASSEEVSIETPMGAKDLTELVSPAQRISEANDATAREDIRSLLYATELFIVDNSGTPPTAEGNPLPAVTSSSLMQDGVATSLLDRMVPSYLASSPKGVNGEYRIGIMASGQIIVGGYLTDGSVFSLTM